MLIQNKLLVVSIIFINSLLMLIAAILSGFFALPGYIYYLFVAIPLTVQMINLAYPLNKIESKFYVILKTSPLLVMSYFVFYFSNFLSEDGQGSIFYTLIASIFIIVSNFIIFNSSKNNSQQSPSIFLLVSNISTIFSFLGVFILNTYRPLIENSSPDLFYYVFPIIFFSWYKFLLLILFIFSQYMFLKSFFAIEEKYRVSNQTMILTIILIYILLYIVLGYVQADIRIPSCC